MSARRQYDERSKAGVRQGRARTRPARSVGSSRGGSGRVGAGRFYLVSVCIGMQVRAVLANAIMAHRGQDLIGIVLGKAKGGEGLSRLHGTVRPKEPKEAKRPIHHVGPGQERGVRAGRHHVGASSRNEGQSSE